MLLDYLDAAEKFSRFENKEEFLAQFGETTRAIQGLYEGMSRDAEGIGQAVFELHKRHGEGVMRVVADLISKNTAKLLRGELSPNSIVALISRAGLERSGVKAGETSTGTSSPWTGGEYMFRRHGDNWLICFRGGEIYPIDDHRGMVHIHTLLHRPGEFISTDALTTIAEGHDVASDSLQISVDADQEAVASVRRTLDRLQDERDEAKEFCHHDEVIRIEGQIEQLVQWLAQETRRGGKAGREPKAVKKSRDRVWKAIDRAIQRIKKHSKPMAEHLNSELERGHLCRYRLTGIPWEL